MAKTTISHKYCPSCKTNKLLSEFAKDPSVSSGLHGFCRICKNRKGKLRYHAQSAKREQLREQRRLRSLIAEPDLPNENWRPIAGFEKYYAVSDVGRVRRVDRGKLLRAAYNPDSKVRSDHYPLVVLHQNGKGFTRKVHKLVAETFISRVEGRNHVNHKNGDPADNRPCNLEWVTPKENTFHAIHVLKRPQYFRPGHIPATRKKRVAV